MFRGTRLVVHEPLRQSKADLSRAKDTFLFHFDVCDKSAEWWDLCKTLCLGEKPLRRKRQSIAYPKTHEREHPIGHPVLGSYPSSALLPLSPGERVPLPHRGKQQIDLKISRSSLCLWMMNPPRLHTIAWSTVKASPQIQRRACQLFSSHSGDERHPWTLSCLK